MKTILNFLHFSYPTKEQEAVLKAMEIFVQDNNPDDFLILCGAAGTGKTSITSALIGYLNSIDKDYHIAAPTGRAARIIGRKANTQTSTIHSLIYIPESNKETGKVTFILKERINTKPSIYIIDEASMINSAADKENTLFEVEKGLLFDLIKFIKSENVDNKIIFLGDRYQLPPIGEEDSLALQKEFLEKAFNFYGSAHELTEVKRQEDGSYILEIASDIKNAIDAGKSSHIIEGEKSKSSWEAAKKYVKDFNSKGPEHSIVINSSHKSNDFFNNLVRDELFRKSQKLIEPGDLMIVLQNWQRNGVSLHNGDHVQVLSVDWGIQEEVADLHFVALKIKLLVSEVEKIIEDYALLETIITPGGNIDQKKEMELRKTRYIKNPRFKESEKPEDDKYVGALRLAYGHAITCNKAQGGEWHKVFINGFHAPSLKWQYTAVTRAIDDIETF